MADDLAPRSPIVSITSHPRANPNLRNIPKLQTKPFGPRVTMVSSLAGKDPEPTEYIVPGLIPKGAVTLLAGHAGIGKSFLCQMLMTSCAFGLPWLGQEVRKCRSFALFSEDIGARLHERQLRLCEHHGVDIFDFEEMACWIEDDHNDFALYETKNKWEYTGRPTDLWGNVARYVQENGIELLILDNVSTIFRSEGTKMQVQDFVRFFKAQAHRLNVAIVILVHPPKNRESWFSGVQTWEDAVRHAISVERAEPDDPQCRDLMLKIPKSNYMPEDHPLKMVGLRLGKDSNGILVHREPEPGHLGSGLIDRLELDAKVLAGAKHAIKRGWKLAADPGSPNYLPRRLLLQKQWVEAGVRPQQLAASVERLQRDGKLILVTVDGKNWLLRPVDSDLYLGEIDMGEAAE